jgi:hypothetical protein
MSLSGGKDIWYSLSKIRRSQSAKISIAIKKQGRRAHFWVKPSQKRSYFYKKSTERRQNDFAYFKNGVQIPN